MAAVPALAEQSFDRSLAQERRQQSHRPAETTADAAGGFRSASVAAAHVLFVLGHIARPTRWTRAPAGICLEKPLPICLLPNLLFLLPSLLLSKKSLVPLPLLLLCAQLLLATDRTLVTSPACIADHPATFGTSATGIRSTATVTVHPPPPTASPVAESQYETATG